MLCCEGVIRIQNCTLHAALIVVTYTCILKNLISVFLIIFTHVIDILPELNCLSVVVLLITHIWILISMTALDINVFH